MMTAALLAIVGVTGQFQIPDTDFARAVVAEYPALADAATTDHERVVMLRQWAWSHTNSVMLAEQAQKFAADRAWQKCDAPGHFARYESEAGGSWCGDAAIGLRKLYSYFGYKAWYLGSSGGKDVSHATTLVEIDIDGERRIVMQDAYFNEEFRDIVTNRPLDYFDMLKRLAEHQEGTILVVESDFHAIKKWPKFIVPAQYRVGMTDAECVTRCSAAIDALAKCETKGDGTLVITSPRGWSKQFEKLCLDRTTGLPAWHLQRIIAAGNPPSMLYYFRWCHRISGGPDSAALQSQAIAIAGPEPR